LNRVGADGRLDHPAADIRARPDLPEFKDAECRLMRINGARRQHACEEQDSCQNPQHC
jgi:hypothetical protein